MEDARKDLSPESNQPSTSDQPTSALVVPRTRAGANDPMVGAVINEKYRVVTVLATGGMGRIYTAEQIPLGRMVALKVILPTLADAMDDPETGRELIRRRFLREASVLAKLQHANIVTVFDYGRIETPASDRERFFMAMELLEGETLEQRIEHGALPEAEALGLLRQMARGLRAAHAQGTVHRDLKPSNLMLVDGPEADSIVKLLDFGVTKVMGEKSQELTDEGVVVGSPRFMSPEHMGGNVDGRTDIYSFGIIAYTMLTGSPPFKGETSMLTMMAHLNNPLPSIVKTRPELGVSEWVDAVIHRCCAKAPADRYQTAQELIDALRPPGDGASGGVRLRTSSGEIQVAQARVEPSGAGERQGDDEATAFLPAGRSSPSRKPLVPGLVFVAAIGAAVFLWSRKPIPVAELVPVAQAQTSRISVTSTPSDVEVYGDGKLLGRTPFTTAVPTGSPKTHLELKRAGYAVFAKDIDPVHDVEVVAVLALDAPSAPPPPPAPTSPSPPRRSSQGPHGGAVSYAGAASQAPPPPPAAPTAPPPLPPPAKKVDPFEDRQ